MGDAQNQGGRGDGWVGRSGEDCRPQRRDYGERWLERRLHGLYQNVIDEPVPHEMLDIVARIPAPLTSGSPPTKLEHPSEMSDEALARACRWRARAEEVRTAAEPMTSEAARSSLLHLARNYEALADSLELLICERLSQSRRGYRLD